MPLPVSLTLAALLLCGAALSAWLGEAQRPRLRVEVGPDQQATVAEVDVGEFAGTLMLGGFRGLAIDLLWMRATSAKDAGRFYESVALFRMISKTQPQFETVWEYMAWDLAYNIPNEIEGRAAKYSWFLSGLEAAVEGSLRNPRAERLMRYLAWMFVHKGATFVEEVEQQDWRPLLGPLLSQGNFEVPAVGSSPYLIGATIYRHLLDQATHRGYRVPAFIRRLLPINLEHDGNLARNRGQHQEALRRYLRALRMWQETAAWAEAEAERLAQLGDEAALRDRDQVIITRDTYQRSEGALRRKTAQLARLLARDADFGQAMATNIMERRFAQVEASLGSDDRWRQRIAQQFGVRWYDEDPLENP